MFLWKNYTSGKGILNIYGNTYEITKRQIFIIPKDVPNFYQADAEDPWSYMYVGFTGKLIEPFAKLPPVMDFHSNIFTKMADVMNLTSMQAEFLAGKLFDLYRILFSDDSAINYANAIQDFIDTNYMLPDISVEQIAQALNLNRSYITRYFKQKTNMTIQDYLINTRMAHAIDLLKQQNSVQEVARRVGYTDSFVFSKMFKKRIGCTPNDFKKKPH